MDAISVINAVILEMQAEACKALTSPKRIAILYLLKHEEKSVSELATALGASQSSVSQHLANLKLKGFLIARREGTNVYYRVANPKVIEACVLLKEALLGSGNGE